ncbi:ultraviolet-B receptor UVR8-like [Zingiber officinale]|uniref:RCC1-like domain-containing protein n=1 Tax=Zingiber officinale TaxID=94328 RepID=A0A8J5HY25_ZINOF|nr:ultraviolet-B receptor UVR8-like [Zingiber officinale]KAG6532524.1 hypothetical protein ZIOFF_006370 [Zingiber officinale]
MADNSGRPFCIGDLPAHLILEILSSGQLCASDLACFETTCRMFSGVHALEPIQFLSIVEFAACRHCEDNSIFSSLPPDARSKLLRRCGDNWKKVLRFLQSVEQSFSSVKTSAGEMQIATGKYHTLLVHDMSVYFCGSSLSGVLDHDRETKQSAAFSRIDFPSPSRVAHISASHNHAAFVLQSGEVFTCGDNSSFCCGHGEVSRIVFRPTAVETMKGIPCKQVATGINFTVFLTLQGQVYTCGSNEHGQLGHGDTSDRPVPTVIEVFEEQGHNIVQIAAGASYTLAVTDDGTVHSFGSCTNFCLGYEEQHDQLVPRAIQSFKSRNIHILRVSAGDEHAVALDSSGYVYTWGRGYCGALGHGDEINQTSPELLNSMKCNIAVQVFARKRKTFVVTDEGLVFAFGWMCFGSLGLSDRGSSDKVMEPRLLSGLSSHRVSQISTGAYHTVAVTKRGDVFGFGDNEKAQIGPAHTLSYLEPTEMALPLHSNMVEDCPPPPLGS